LVAFPDEAPLITSLPSPSPSWAVTTRLSNDWSNLQSHELSLPLFINAALLQKGDRQLYLSAAPSSSLNFSAGTNEVVSLGIAGNSVIPYQQMKGATRQVFYGPYLKEPGLYPALSNGDTLHWLALNVPLSESTLNPIEETKSNPFVALYKAVGLEDDSSDLSTFFLLAALFFLICESGVTRFVLPQKNPSHE
jgi:hypothetical protein